MNFTTATKVRDTINASDQVEMDRGLNRTRVNNAANGFPPLSPSEAKDWNLKINCDFGEFAIALQQGRRQYYNAFLKPGGFFKVTIPLAPIEKKLEWEIYVTRNINRIMKKSREFFELDRSKFASVVAHGIGPVMWTDKDSWLPDYVAVEDLRVPTDTKLSFRNQEWFAVRHAYTEGELTEKVFSPHSSDAWNKKIVAAILKEYHDINYEQTSYDWMLQPEKMAELVKQNLGYYSSDAVPTIPLWHFYFRDKDKKGKQIWLLRVVTDLETKGNSHDEFLYDTDKPCANKISEILAVQFGDLNNKAPFLYHSVRSLGFLLMEPCFWTNLMRCKLLQHTFETFNVWLRSIDPAGRDRAQKVDLMNKSFMPEGVSIVPQNERHQINSGLVETVMANLRQLMNEASVAYTQDADTGTRKEQTATEVMAKVTQVNAMTSGLLSTAFHYETFVYQEICRRFCLSKSSDPDVIDFQKQCKNQGIPRMWLNSELWDIEPEVPMGAGNPTMEMAQAQALLQIMPLFNDPAAKQEILHEVTEAFSGDPRRAERWAPVDKKRGVSDAQRDAEFAFGTLMQGVAVRMKEGLNPSEQIETLIGLTAGVIARIGQQPDLVTPGEIVGLQTVFQYVGQLMQGLSQNPQEKQKLKQYAEALGQLGNSLKTFAQQLAQKQSQNGNGVPPEVQGKLMASKIKAESDAKNKEAKTAQQMSHKEKSFEAQQRRDDAKTYAQIQRDAVTMKAELGQAHMATRAEITQEAMKAESQPQTKQE